MPLLTSLLLLIVLSRLLGQLFIRYQQPAIVGEMLAGVILGPTLLKLVYPGAALAGISELAVFLIVLSAGLEMNFKDVLSALGGKGLIIGILGFIIPLLSGIAVGLAFQLDVMRTIILGLTISITALPVAIRVLDSFKLLQSDIARYSIGTAILNDIAALLAFGVILSLPEQRTFLAVATSIVWTGGKLGLLAACILGFNFLLEKIYEKGVHIERVSERLINAFGSEALLGIVVAFVLVFSSFSEMLGFHFVIGAFFGALIVDKKFFLASRYSELEKSLGSVTGGFLAPVFFAYLGLELDVAAITSPLFLLVVLAIAIVSKIGSGWIGGRFIGLSKPESLGIGIILNGRGVMGLVIASIAFERGYIGQGFFSTLVVMSIVTTIIAPMLFRRFVLHRLST
ncbi:MAG: sodium:proton antiporter [Bdellovibrionales bacterium GWB1_55_8]|nr:MAG: sodium:proton antiporter [Bdellovibrionales bacterium GWB1_55_8]